MENKWNIILFINSIILLGILITTPIPATVTVPNNLFLSVFYFCIKQNHRNNNLYYQKKS